MQAIAGVEVVICVVGAAMCVSNLTNSNDHGVVNWVLLPTLLIGVMTAMLF